MPTGQPRERFEQSPLFVFIPRLASCLECPGDINPLILFMEF